MKAIDLGLLNGANDLGLLNGATDVIRVPSNTTLIFTLNNDMTVSNNITRQSVYDFDLKQYKTTYDDCFVAMEKAVLKRVQKVSFPIFLCLSSGYDSGLICCILEKFKIPHHTYTIIGEENPDILKQRFNHKFSFVQRNIINPGRPDRKDAQKGARPQ